jgi:hypothetical protein
VAAHAGRLEYPDRSSPTYRSVTGLIDRRVDLDRSIKPTDSRFDAALCVMASKLAYKNEAFIRDMVTSHWQATCARALPVCPLSLCVHSFGRI